MSIGKPSPISALLRDHYENTFELHGPVAKGVDWGAEEDVVLRYEKMLEVIQRDASSVDAGCSILDVGCGYGGLLEHVKRSGLSINYTGIDLCENMITHARQRHDDNAFIIGDILTYDISCSFDYVVCSGVLTQKLTASIQEMDRFANRMICRMFELCRRGIAFNIMSTKVNFMVSNLYYRHPVDMLAYCLSQVTDNVIVDHAYRLYEYTTYLYRQGGR